MSQSTAAGSCARIAGSVVEVTTGESRRGGNRHGPWLESGSIGWSRAGAATAARPMTDGGSLLEFEDVPSCATRCSSPPSRAGTTPARPPSSAVEHLAEVWDAEAVAALDPEDYYDFQVNRPRGAARRRATADQLAHHPRSSSRRDTAFGRDVVLVQGIEPSIRWRAFTIELMELPSGSASRRS